MAEPREYTVGSSTLVMGADSYTKPDELGDAEYIMGMNVVCRGGIVQTRPGTRTVFCLPDGNFQGCTLFTPANGISQLVFAVDGKVYVSSAPFTEYRRLRSIQFSNTSKYMAWAVCLKSTDYDAAGNLISLANPYSVLVMQDGLTRAAYWDGNTAAHLNPSPAPDNTDTAVSGYQETPVGLWMIWSGNRLWVSRGNQVFASDIGNPLKFTEAQYLNEARAFYLSGDCTGMIEVPTDANTSKGFIAFTETDGTLFQSYIQDRTEWLNTPLFQNTIIPTIGCVAPRSLVTQYGLNWWFGPRGLTNINSALRQNITSRIDYQDNEMFASKAYLSPELSGVCGIFYENYLLMSVPSQDVYNRHTWVLDQAPFEGNASSWAGFWSGWRPIEWARGIVNGEERLFFGSVDYDGKNRIWEAMLPDRTDNGCRITCYAQLRDHAAGNLDQKRYEWSKFFLSQIYGDVDLNAYVASTKGGYQFQKGYHIVASQGQVYSDVEYSELGPYLIGNIVQSRTIRTPADPQDNECNACGVESKEGNMIDYAFSHLLVWSGQMGIRAYQMHMRESPDRNDGDCEEAEVGPRSLNSMGCSGLELLVSTGFFEVFTARADGSATTGRGQQVYLQFAGFSIISAADAQANAEERVASAVGLIEGKDIAPGNYGSPEDDNGDPVIPWPDGGAGITPESDGGGVLGPGGGGAPGPNGGGPSSVVVIEDEPNSHPEAPTFVQQPVAVVINDGENASFTVAVDGFLPIVFQWQVDDGGGWVNITDGGIYSGATTAELTLTAATTAETGYLYRCRATNEIGAVFSDSAELTVNAAPSSDYMNIPPLTEDTGAWFPDLVSAEFAINNFVADCLVLNLSPFLTLSASGTSPFTINGTTPAGTGIIQPWFSINGGIGDVLTIAHATNPAVVNFDCSIYNDSGTLIQYLNGVGPLVLDPLTYTGRYILQVRVIAGSTPITSCQITVSSSGSLVVNPVRALYDCGNPDPCYVFCP